MACEKKVFDVRLIPIESFLDDSVSSDAESFVYKKYTDGRPNGSLDATEDGFKKSLSRMLGYREPEALFGTRIKEAIRQWRILFG